MPWMPVLLLETLVRESLPAKPLMLTLLLICKQSSSFQFSAGTILFFQYNNMYHILRMSLHAHAREQTKQGPT